MTRPHPLAAPDHFYLNIALIVITMIAGAYPLLHIEVSKILYVRTTYPILLALTAMWFFQWTYWARTQQLTAESFFKKNWQGLALSAGISLVIFISVPPYLRVLADETNLLAVSKSMIHDHGILNSTMGKWYYESYYPIASEPPVRPSLYPFLTHLLHLLLGYHQQNAFLVNYLSLTAMLFLCYRGFADTFGKIAGMTSVLMVCSQPLVTLTATSGGFDLLNLTMAAAFFAALKSFLEIPTAQSFSLFWITGLLFSHVRYESIVFFALTSGALMLFGKIKWGYFKSSILYGLTPLFIFPLIWGKQFASTLKDPLQSGREKGFAFDHSLTHLKEFLEGAFIPSTIYPYAALINWIAAAGLVYILIQIVKGKKSSWPESSRILIILALIFSFAYLILLLSFHAGFPIHPTNARYFVLAAFPLSVTAAYFLNRISWLQNKRTLVLFIALGLFIYYHARSVENRFSLNQTLPRLYHRALAYLEKQDNRNILIITDRPGMYTAHNYGAVRFDYARKHSEQLLRELDRRLFQDIYVIQEIDTSTQLPLKGMHLPEMYLLDPVYRYLNIGGIMVKISKVKRR